MSVEYAIGCKRKAPTAAKKQAWADVVERMLAGELRVGSRKPTRFPEWVTLQVLHGGFATSTPLAALEEGDEPNAEFLTPEGLERLGELFATGRYLLKCPENGALLVVWWLQHTGREDLAQELLERVEPFFDALRFYPYPAAQVAPERDAGDVSVLDVRDVREGLARQLALRDGSIGKRRREAAAATLSVWEPLACGFLEQLRKTRDGAGALFGTEAHHDAGWQAEVAKLVDQHRDAAARHRRTRRARTLQTVARACEAVLAGRNLTAGATQMLHEIFAAWDARRARAGIGELHARQLQAALRADAVPAEVHRRLAALGDVAPGDGLTSEQAAKVLGGVEGLGRLGRRVRACQRLPLAQHVEEGAVASPDMLARPVQQLVASTAACEHADPRVRRLRTQLYVSFRARRSVLLLNLERQEQYLELPWAAALQPQRAGPEASTARQALGDVLALLLSRWPHRIVPNKLLQELAALVKAAGLEDRMPTTKEIAADIFESAYSPSFVRAARIAAEVMGGTTYERYYQLQGAYAELRSSAGAKTDLHALSKRILPRLLLGAGRAGRVVHNGMCIERAMILTTHNLAQALHGCPELRDRLDLPAMVKQCFVHAAAGCATAALPSSWWQDRLHAMKDAAYAWRQMVVYLSLLPTDSQLELVNLLPQMLVQDRWGTQFDEGLMHSLRMAIEGPAAPSHAKHPDRVMLGWCSGQLPQLVSWTWTE